MYKYKISHNNVKLLYKGGNIHWLAIIDQRVELNLTSNDNYIIYSEILVVFHIQS
jgi:hypothetical protein